MRDILQERVKAGRNEETVEIVNRHFDLVMVHGDPAFASLGDTFPLAADDRRGDRLYRPGGGAAPGAVAGALRRADLGRRRRGRQAAGRRGRRCARAWRPARRWCLITGPNLPQADFDARRPRRREGLEIVRFRKDFPALLAAAELSVSQAGYNTVCDILQAGCRSILVPFAAGGETEQTVRAERLQRLGLALSLPEDELSPSSLAAAIERQLASAEDPARTGSISTAHGSRRVVLRGLLAEGAAQTAPISMKRL